MEGPVDETVIRRLVRIVGAAPGPIHGKHGKGHLRRRIVAYNKASRFAPWSVLIDLDGEAECAPILRNVWLAEPEPRMCFRIAVHAVESWLLADRERISQMLPVPTSRVPPDPEAVPDPKRFIVDLARQSRRRRVREDIVPRPGSGKTWDLVTLLQ